MSDDFLHRLHSILDPQEAEKLSHEILAWNDELEVIWRNPDAEHSSTNSLTVNSELVREVSGSLLCTFLELLQGRSICQSLENTANQSSTRDFIRQHLYSQLHSWKDGSANVLGKVQWSDLYLFVRTMKNWWRWYLQIYLPLQGKSPLPGVNFEVVRQQVEDSWRAVEFFELLLLLMEAFVTRSAIQPSDSYVSNGSHHVANLLFYITYSLSPNDSNLLESYHFLISECQLMDRLLSLLIRANVGMPLRLSILRNLHNALVSFPKIANEAVVKSSYSGMASTEEWMHPNENNSFTYTSVVPDLLTHSLTFPKHDGESWDDHRNAELVVEALRCCYALNMTLDLRWHGIFDSLLQLDASRKPHFLDCQCAAVPVLMDAPRVFRERLTEDRVVALVHILDHQVTNVVLQDRCVDDRAAAALNPILAVLYKLCVEQPTLGITTIRTLVFPDWDARQLTTTSPKNMSPVDAPEGTLRWKLIQLLTWPQGFVKRLAGELLFVLCDLHQQEFIYRVGMGNAVAFLSVKGLIQLPGSVHT